MEREINKNLNSVINSFNGSQRAQPSPKLFEKILAELPNKTAAIIPIRTFWLSVAAAILLIFINISAVSSYSFSQNNKRSITQSNNTEAYSLVSNYNIYE